MCEKREQSGGPSDFARGPRWPRVLPITREISNARRSGRLRGLASIVPNSTISYEFRTLFPVSSQRSFLHLFSASMILSHLIEVNESKENGTSAGLYRPPESVTIAPPVKLTASPNYESAAGAISDTVIDWIAEIKKVWARGASSTMDLARVVSAAKNRLQQHYGQWSQLWKSGQKMPLSKSTADQLAVIGLRMGGLDSQTSENLPQGWNILYCLARLDRGTLEQLIQQGIVHPQLTLREAKELVAQFRGERAAVKLRKANVRERLRRFAEFVRQTVSDWESEEREWVTNELTGLIEEIGTAGGDRLQVEWIANPRTFITRFDFMTDQPNDHL